MADSNLPPVTPFTLETPAGFTPAADNPIVNAGAAGGLTPPVSDNSQSGTSTNDAPFKVLEGGSFQFGDKQFTMDELVPIIQAGMDPSEIHKAATTKFQEAAELQRQNDEKAQKFGYLDTVAQSLAAMPKEGQDAIFAFARQVDEAFAQGKPLPTPGQVTSTNPWQNPAIDTSKIPKFEELSEEAQAVATVFMQQLAAQNATIASMQQSLQVLPEVSNFVKGSQQERQANEAIVAIKGEFGADVTLADLQTAIKETGNPNPQQAWVYHNRATIQANAANKAAADTGKAPITPPTGQGRTFDPRGKSPEEIFANLNAGATMTS